MLVSAESQVPKLISREIILPNSNACDHNPPTLQTDGQTDGQTTYHGNTALRFASRGKKPCCVGEAAQCDSKLRSIQSVQAVVCFVNFNHGRSQGDQR